MAEGIPLQIHCRCRPKYEEEEEYYYPPKDQCRSLQLLAEGYPLFHPCLSQSYRSGEPPLQECQCQRELHVHYGVEQPPQNQCGCRQPPATEGYPLQDRCRCRQVPVGNGHPSEGQCHSGRLLPIADGHPPQDQCRERQLPAGDGQSPQDECQGQNPSARKPQLVREGFPLHDDQFPGHQQPNNGEGQPKHDQNGGGKQDGEAHKTNQHRHDFNEEEQVKNGSYYQNDSRSSSLARLICICISIFLLLAGATILILWLIYRPHKPRFTVVGAAIYDLNTTFPPFVSTTMQFTIIIKNPNKRVSIYYDKLSAFVSYKDQAITTEAMMPPLHMKKRSTVAVAPVIGGTPVQVSMDVENGLAIDEIYGVMGLKLVFMGRLRWKVGAIKTKHYGIHVSCDVMMDLNKGCVGPVPLLGSPNCNVDI